VARWRARGPRRMPSARPAGELALRVAADVMPPAVGCNDHCHNSHTSLGIARPVVVPTSQQIACAPYFVAVSVQGAAPRCGEMKIACRCGLGAWLRLPWSGSTLKGCFGDPVPPCCRGARLKSVGLEGIPLAVVRGRWIVASEHASETSAFIFSSPRNTFHNNTFDCEKG